METNRQDLNRQLAQMLKGGVIMDVTTPEQARIAEAAGACAVMALERIPADIRAAGGVSRMSDPKMIRGIQEAVSIPVMAKCRIGHIAEAQILQAIEIDYIDESEVLSPADGHRDRLYRRERGTLTSRQHLPHRQDQVRRALRLRCQEPRRSPAPYCRGCHDDPHEGRARHRRCRTGRQSHASYAE